jgi:hypothetical protein
MLKHAYVQKIKSLKKYEKIIYHNHDDESTKDVGSVNQEEAHLKK